MDNVWQVVDETSQVVMEDDDIAKTEIGNAIAIKQNSLWNLKDPAHFRVSGSVDVDCRDPSPSDEVHYAIQIELLAPWAQEARPPSEQLYVWERFVVFVLLRNRIDGRVAHAIPNDVKNVCLNVERDVFHRVPCELKHHSD